MVSVLGNNRNTLHPVRFVSAARIGLLPRTPRSVPQRPGRQANLANLSLLSHIVSSFSSAQNDWAGFRLAVDLSLFAGHRVIHTRNVRSGHHAGA